MKKLRIEFSYYKIIFSILLIISLIMVSLYFFQFNGSLSIESNDWANFGSYMSPITNIITMSILILTLFLQKKDNIENIKRIDSQHMQNIEALNKQIQIAEVRVKYYKIEKEIELYTSFLTAMNNYLIEITRICMNFMRVNRLYHVLKGEEVGNEESIFNEDDFLTKIKIVNSVLKEINNIYKDKTDLEFNQEMYYKKFITACKELLEYDLFIRITEKMQIDTVGYIYFMEEHHQRIYNSIIIEIQKSTNLNMKRFSISKFKDDIESYNNKIIFHIELLRNEIKEG